MTNKTQDRRALRDERRNRIPPTTPPLPKIPEIDWEKLKEMPVLSDKHVPEQAVATLVDNGRGKGLAQEFVTARAEEIKAKFRTVGQAAHKAAGHQGNIATENARTTRELRDWLLDEFDKSS